MWTLLGGAAVGSVAGAATGKLGASLVVFLLFVFIVAPLYHYREYREYRQRRDETCTDEMIDDYPEDLERVERRHAGRSMILLPIFLLTGIAASWIALGTGVYGALVAFPAAAVALWALGRFGGPNDPKWKRVRDEWKRLRSRSACSLDASISPPKAGAWSLPFSVHLVPHLLDGVVSVLAHPSVAARVLLRIGRVAFSLVTTFEAILLLFAAWFSLQIDTTEDVALPKTDIDALDLLASGAMVGIAIIFALGAIAVWIKCLPGRTLLLGATIAGLLAIHFVWLLNGLGITEIYFD
jgi:hypothetical protein